MTLFLQEPDLGDGPYQHLSCCCPASPCAYIGQLYQNQHWAGCYNPDLIQQGALGILGHDQQQCKDNQLPVYHQHCSNNFSVCWHYSGQGFSNLQHTSVAIVPSAAGNLNDLGLTIQVYSRGPGVYITGAMGDITMNASWLRLDAEYYSSAAADLKLAEQKSKPHQLKFLNTAHQTQSVAMTTGNIYPIQLVLLNGLVLFVWFIMQQSTTGAGLTTGMQITNYKWRDLHNTSLQNRVLARDTIARYEYGTREFDSVFFQQVYAYPTCWVPRPCELIKHLANTWSQYLESSFLNITSAVTATMVVDVYAVCLAIPRWAIVS